MSRDYSQKELRVLYTQSGNLCAFPGCNGQLTHPETAADDAVNVSDIAHIVADSRQGPRGRDELSNDDRNKHSNFILLCEKHHRIVDSQPHTYSVAVLRRMKADHQARVAKLVAPASRPASPVLLKELLHSTLMTVTHLPGVVFKAPCKYPDDEAAVKRELVYPPRRPDLLFPFILREGHVFTFDDIRKSWSVFQNVVNRQQVELIAADTLLGSPEGHRRYVTLLNRSLYKYCGRLNIHYDPNRKRFYFAVDGVGEERLVKYRPLNQAEAERKVAWLPKNKRTGEARNFWIHLAAGLRFQHIAPRQWCLAIRPERHLTADGVTSLEAEQIGPRVTRMKARMYNHGYLTEVQFWRDILCRGTPRLIVQYGEQSLICDSALVSCDISWPGIPNDSKSFKNQTYTDDLFTMADFERALEGAEIMDEDDTFDADEEAADVDT